MLNNIKNKINKYLNSPGPEFRVLVIIAIIAIIIFK
tara:strand:- start:2030 stop:2137 length:108 start_codon:yes stop_codon:yes gene_type:complete